MKKKILIFLFSFLFLPFCSLIIILIIDPMLNFGFVNNLNKNFIDTMEREQKTNLAHRTAKNYDSILLGSSRSTYINQNDFLEMKVFNYGLNAARLSEIKPYLDFFVQSSKKEPKNIIIGVDFHHTGKEYSEPKYQQYINNVDKIEYVPKLFFSFDIFKFTLKSFKDYSKTELPHYNRYNEKFQNKVSNENKFKLYKGNLLETFRDDKYAWNDQMLNKYQDIKNTYPNSKIIIFTQPITADRFASITQKMDRLKYYKKWIKSLVEVFDEIYCFMGINSITSNLDNYKDDNHFYPYIGKIIAYKLSTMDFESEPKDFGVIVNKDNVDEFLEFQAKQLENYEFSEFYPHDEIDKIINEVK